MQRLGLGKSSGGSIAAGRNYNAQKGRLQERLRGVPTQCKDSSRQWPGETEQSAVPGQRSWDFIGVLAPTSCPT